MTESRHQFSECRAGDCSKDCAGVPEIVEPQIRSSCGLSRRVEDLVRGWLAARGRSVAGGGEQQGLSAVVEAAQVILLGTV